MKDVKYKGKKLFVSIYDAVDGAWKKVGKEDYVEVTDLQYKKLKEAFGKDIVAKRGKKE